ncbi:hypothetical protein O9992_28210 [Vibrio lentus]|nr:hypothetical protein [Vibrio lentus]
MQKSTLQDPWTIKQSPVKQYEGAPTMNAFTQGSPTERFHYELICSTPKLTPCAGIKLKNILKQTMNLLFSTRQHIISKAM